MGTRQNRLGEAVLTSTHNLCFLAEIRKIMYTPVNPSFTILKWGLRGLKLYRYVFVMVTQIGLLPSEKGASLKGGGGGGGFTIAQISTQKNTTRRKCCQT